MVYFTNNTNVLYGSGTVFTKQISVGDHITVDGQTSRVTQIVSDTQLKLNASLVGSYTSDTPVSWSRKWRYADSFTAEPATSTSIRTLKVIQLVITTIKCTWLF